MTKDSVTYLKNSVTDNILVCTKACTIIVLHGSFCLVFQLQSGQLVSDKEMHPCDRSCGNTSIASTIGKELLFLSGCVHLFHWVHSRPCVSNVYCHSQCVCSLNNHQAELCEKLTHCQHCNCLFL